MRYMLNRLTEASTWAGIGAIVTSSAQSAQTGDPITAVVGGIAGLAASH